ncbi:MAG: 50S ribosomal protein L35 [Deltaproteobacteria bacterium]|nr:50S ribosomal protein L35 [Deltaproteobacteria bacterium]
MPKAKTHKATKKRFKLSATGKVLYKASNARHILTKKTSKRKRHIRGVTTLAKADSARIRNLLGNPR